MKAAAPAVTLALLLAGAAVAATPVDPLPPLRFPVPTVDPHTVRDSFDDRRGGGVRPHEAIDIMAARGTPVVAVADGPVARLFHSVPGGLTVYQFDATGTLAYYYAHLDAYAPGLAEKQVLKAGDPIGFVGSTGNASPEAPHLHFAVFVLGPLRQWWKGTAVDPFAALTKSDVPAPPVLP